jgi:hypothetical protein
MYLFEHFISNILYYLLSWKIENKLQTVNSEDPTLPVASSERSVCVHN